MLPDLLCAGTGLAGTVCEYAGSLGGTDQLDHTGLITRDATGSLHIDGAPAIRVFSPSGQLMYQWNVIRENDGSFEDILEFDVFPVSTVVVAQTHGTSEESLCTCDRNGTLLSRWTTSGWADGKVEGIRGIMVGRGGRINVMGEILYTNPSGLGGLPGASDIPRTQNGDRQGVPLCDRRPDAHADQGHPAPQERRHHPDRLGRKIRNAEYRLNGKSR